MEERVERSMKDTAIKKKMEESMAKESQRRTNINMKYLKYAGRSRNATTDTHRWNALTFVSFVLLDGKGKSQEWKKKQENLKEF